MPQPPTQQLDPAAASANRSISPHNSSTPLISERQRQDLRQAGSATATANTATTDAEKDSKTGKRRLPLFGLGKKKEEKQAMDAPPSTAATAAATSQPPPAGIVAQKQQQQQQPDLKPSAQPIPVSPSRLPYQPAVAASPSRLRSASPRLHSPASSEIFERNVQEPVPISTLGGELSPAHIPSHVITEDSIPPALEASAQAITSEELNPDEVEIVTSASHQPAATVLEPSASHADLTSLNSPPALLQQQSEESEVASSLNLHHASIASGGVEDDSASNYGQLDPNDVRRLSFISFKDIVHSEHQQMVASSLGEIGSRDSLHIANLPSSGVLPDRAASPLRSPRSPTSTHSHTLSSGLSTPPPGANINPIGSAHAEQSPVRSIGIGSPNSSQHGELTIETMRQALRKTASGDLSSGRSAGMSPVSDENSVRNEPRSRTNT